VLAQDALNQVRGDLERARDLLRRGREGATAEKLRAAEDYVRLAERAVACRLGLRQDLGRPTREGAGQR
jgi:hypothetical protein